MSNVLSQWQLLPQIELPEWFIVAVQEQTGDLLPDRASAPPQPSHQVAQLLWQRGIRELEQLAGFLNPDCYQPASPFEFGQEMQWAIARLQQAQQNGERIAIWGDFDADGITATAVLWEGLGQFFPHPQQRVYHIPNRLTESHGLAIAHLETIAQQGYRLIVTCDTGSTNLDEIAYAQQHGIDLIITDHHTLPTDRPPVVAILNPRSLPTAHPLSSLSGVAVAYKLVEALYETMPTIPQAPLEELLDLVAIGLIADLVELTGDCRYLAQRGIEQLQKNHRQNGTPRRPGIARLLELCRKNGDRPTDISYGIGPRINAISRIYGEASFAVELLTSQEVDRCLQLAEDTELANTRRKALQKEVIQQVKARLTQLDLSTTSVIVLADPQWSVGVLGLVAGQIAQEYDRPTILLSTDAAAQVEESSDNLALTPSPELLARGSARSVKPIDLYQLVHAQRHLLHRFGGHPYAAGLSLPIDNIPLFTEAINRQQRHQDLVSGRTRATIQADLAVTVVELGQELFRQLKLLEPYGMGNPVPKLLLRHVWFQKAHHQNISDWKKRKVRYIKTEFELWDDTVAVGFPGVWWEHYKDEIPSGRCDAIAELDFNPYHKRYEIRLIAVRPSTDLTAVTTEWMDELLDWRGQLAIDQQEDILLMMGCPGSWDELSAWFRQALHNKQRLAIAYPTPPNKAAIDYWHQLVGIAKYLSRTQQAASRTQLLEKLEVGDRVLQLGLESLKHLGFEVTTSSTGVELRQTSDIFPANAEEILEVRLFLEAVQEEQFRRRYFNMIPLTTIQAVLEQTMGD